MSAAPVQDLVKRWESEQAHLRLQVVEEDTEDWQRSPDFSGLERVAGVDLSFIKGDDINACAQLVVLNYPDLEVLYEDSQMVTLTAPYIAGFLAFRETPSLLEALQRLQKNQPTLLPQVVFVDGNGLFHYREFGLACHLGVLSGLPCVGVAKNLLQVQGVYKSEEHQSQIAALQKGGESFPLTSASGKMLGKALRSSDSSSKPVYVSVGHKISLDTAVRLTHSCCRYRVPEPIRQHPECPICNTLCTVCSDSVPASVGSDHMGQPPFPTFNNDPVAGSGPFLPWATFENY
ncbi:endonuclease V isoform X1 [Echeneis naucrates]|uniref:endonuclease V isoform X1 n=1 Tax=Echeneis naucrates TaxID=173247 RepID=UPI001113DE82|nr:endonuclease V isoform X1 [Echeneis naucrates]